MERLHTSQHQRFPTQKMAAENAHKGESVPSRMAVRTKATSTTGANSKYKKPTPRIPATIGATSKYKKPTPRIPATDPKQIQSLWCQVRKQKLGDMPRKEEPKYLAPTSASSRKASLTSASGTSTTAPTSKSQSITTKNPEFCEKCLTPRGISINDDWSLLIANPYLHFHTEKPSSYKRLKGLEKSVLWLDMNPDFIEMVSKEYGFMDLYQLCEAEYASFAKENLLRREPREKILNSTADPSQRFRRAERMLEFVCKPDNDRRWKAPPLLTSFGEQNCPTYTFDIRPDCSYWLTLHGFNSKYAGQMHAIVHIPQLRMTFPYFTVEFKRDDSHMKKANEQAAAFGSLALFNRYQLRNRVVSDEWTHEQECQLRHYALTITKSLYTFWCIRPNLKDGKWNGCNMDMIFTGSLIDTQGGEYFVEWINEIHRWGLTNHFESCERDIKLLVEKRSFRVSSVGSKECTCGDSLDAAGTSEVQALASTETAHPMTT